MESLKIKTFKSFYPIGLIDGKLYVQKGFRIGAIDTQFNFHFICNIPEKNLFYKFLNILPLARRVLRIGCTDFVKINDVFLVFYRKQLFKSVSNEKLRFIPFFKGYKGSRPLNPGTNQLELVFGEYFSNKKRIDTVKIFKSDGIDTEVMFTFKKGKIRHVHGCKYDPFNKRWIILTGDSNEESKICFTDNNGFGIIGSGSQKFRAVDIIIENKNEIIIPSDTPLERNYIRRFNTQTNIFEDVCAVEGSIFYSKKIKELYIITTVTEPSKVNKTESAHIYCSLNGTNWKKIISIQKDLYPIRLQKLTRYTELKILEGLFLNEFVVIEARATNLVSHGTILISYQEIISHLKLK